MKFEAVRTDARAAEGEHLLQACCTISAAFMLRNPAFAAERPALQPYM
jgi:hypothetical protein